VNDHHELRAALDDLAGRPPLVLGRRGAVMNRIATVQRRRTLAVKAAMSAFLVAGAAAGATHVIYATPAGDDRLLQEPSPTVSEAPDPVATSGAPGEPSYAPETRESHEPSPPGVAEPDPAHEPTHEPVPDPTHEPAGPPAASLSVALAHESATAGTEMHWHVSAYDGAGRLRRIELVFGDGQKLVYEPDTACGDGVELDKYVAHVYADAGTYTGHLSVTTGDCGVETQTRTASSSLTVKPAPSPEATNGPASPTASAEQLAGDMVTLALYGTDADGYVRKFAISWGDGSETYAGPRGLDDCTTADGTSHPAASAWGPQATHAYETPGTYEVHVTVASTSCTGSAVQYGTVTVTVTA
jgi:hypothetical protein